LIVAFADSTMFSNERLARQPLRNVFIIRGGMHHFLADCPVRAAMAMFFSEPPNPPSDAP